MQGEYYSYGAAPAVGKQEKAQFPQGAAPLRMNGTAALFSFVAPIGLFAMVDYVVGSSLHYDSPSLCWLIVSLAFAAVAMCAYLAYEVLAARFARKVSRDPTWYVFLTVSMLAAWCGAVFHGSVNYWGNTEPYNDVQILSSYLHVNVSEAHGLQLMDAGRITFVEGTHIDMTKSMGFKNLEEYCVAPITMNNSVGLASYDFWAVGMNCCSSNAGDFHCGEYDNPRARSGLRVLREDQRPYYRLAVQQAESTFGITSKHPLFFYWAQDATLEMEAYHSDANDFYFMGVLSYFFLQLFMTVSTICAYQKISMASSQMA